MMEPGPQQGLLWKRAGDWACPNPECMNHHAMVFGSKTSCPVCGALKPGLAFKSSSASAWPKGHEPPIPLAGFQPGGKGPPMGCPPLGGKGPPLQAWPEGMDSQGFSLYSGIA